ncbi:terminase large subunit [Pseudomonas nitroreducens]|uniref:terminase large subunit n=1 Tax=Pseudomonas nitroreducens TaxID=46680 RepID=UPI00265816F2|nr:terminase large subunit [Pseudomonas nitroreducens]MCP1646983.1 phage terminase large subunit-like protein [Pseudomonas nitroreducens]MCP1685559.1 phage terminase large subunit-like protein [Pseudomonas nitroreducens]
MDWSTACPDWADRLLSGKSLIPPPIFEDQAEQALTIFKQLCVVDIPKIWDEALERERYQTFGECCEEWVFDFVAAIFGAYDAETGRQLIRQFFLLISKKNAKSTIAAGIMLTAVILCWRENEEHLILAPTKEVADNSFNPAAGMVRADTELTALFHVQEHTRTITHRISRASLKVVAADTDTVSGKKSGKILVDELWVFGKRSSADAMLMEATGGQISRPEGFVIYLSTQSDEPPAGVFASKLEYFRSVRDGEVKDQKSLGIIYEFPAPMIQAKAYLKPENFHITNPNVGRSVSREWLEDNLAQRLRGEEGELRKFLAKHLNIQIGMNLRENRWAGADHWDAGADRTLTLDELIRRSEVVVAGIDGGGLDDLLGLSLVGREKGTRRWLHWAHAWAHRIVLERRKEIATQLLEFQADGDLTIVDLPGDDVFDLADILCRVKDAGLFPEKSSIGVDNAGIGDIVDELTTEQRGFTLDDIVGISQGWKLNGAIKTTERKVAGGEFIHGGQRLMAWCVGNARTVPVGNAIAINKQVSGTAKIDPLMATFDATTLMALNPSACDEGDFNDFLKAPIIV